MVALLSVGTYWVEGPNSIGGMLVVTYWFGIVVPVGVVLGVVVVTYWFGIVVPVGVLLVVAVVIVCRLWSSD